MKQSEAIERADRAIKASNSHRMHADAKWAVSLAYARGSQWRYQSANSAGHAAVRRLNEILDPRRPDVRVTMDMTSQIVRRIVAQLKPVRIQPIVHARGRSARAMAAKQVYTGVMQRVLEAIGAVPVWRALHYPRVVLGPMLIRRQLTTEGRAVRLPPDYKDQEGRPLELHKRVIKWAPVLPFYVIRDPSAIGQDFHAESIFGQEVPRSTDWVQRNFGKRIETEQTMGKLYGQLDSIRRVTGWNLQASAAHSEVPGVVVYEFYFQDASAEAPAGWPWQLICYRDPDASELVPLHFGRNPFYGLPFHMITYGSAINEPWPDGVPALMKSAQDVRNLAATAMVRVMLDHYPKWRIEENTVDAPYVAAMNRGDMPVVWRRTHPNTQPPDRVSPPGASPVANSFWASLAEEGMNAANLAPVQMGEMVKRGQAGKAYEAVVEQADVPINDLIRDDELVLNELLYATLVDTGEITLRPRRDVAYAMLGDDFPPQQVDAALSESPTALIESVKVVPENLRPKTPRQVEQDFTNLVTNQIVEPSDARWEMLTQGDVISDSRMAEAKQRQEMENSMMEGGQECPVTAGEDHATSIRVIEMLMSSPRWYRLDEQAQQRIEMHWAAHKNTQQALAVWETAGMEPSPPAGRPSPPAESAATPTGTVGPAAQVA